MTLRAPVYLSGQRRRRLAGLTILEMLVSSAMLALIIVGLTAMFVQTQKAFKTGTRQTDVSDAGRSIADLLAGDLAQMSDGTPYSVSGAVSGPGYGITNLLWGWDGGYPQYQDGKAFRTNILQGVYLLVQTNTGWTGIGYSVSNLAPGLGVGTLYRYTSHTNAHFIDNNILLSSYLWAFTPNFSNSATVNQNNIHLARVADGIVHLRIIPYDQFGNRVGYETNTSVGEFYMGGAFTNHYPYLTSRLVPQPAPPHVVTVKNVLPYSVDVELGILDPDSWDHLKGLSGNYIAQSNYLMSAAGKVEIFRKRVLVRAANFQ